MACRSWRVTEHRRVLKWLRRHRGYLDAYRRAWRLVASNPYRGETLRGCGLRKVRVGELRVLYLVDGRSCTARIIAVGTRERIYEEFC